MPDKMKRIFQSRKKANSEKKANLSIFSESTLRTSFYEELQKNGWCDIVDDKPENLTKYVQIKKTGRVKE